MPTKYYEIRPSAEMSDEDFERLMADEIIPLVDTKVTRAGGVSGPRLFRALLDSADYILGIEGSGAFSPGSALFKDRTAAAFEAMDRRHISLDSIN